MLIYACQVSCSNPPRLALPTLRVTISFKYAYPKRNKSLLFVVVVVVVCCGIALL